MYIFKNALRSIVRSKGRNILIGIIVLVIAVSSCLALSIRQAAATAEEKGMEQLNITAQISIDRQSLMKNASSSGSSESGKPDRSAMREAMNSVPDLSLEQMQTYAQSSHVKDFLYTMTASLNGGDDLNAVETSATDSGSDSSSQSSQGKGPGGEEDKSKFAGMGQQGDFNVVGVSSTDAMTDFVSGTSSVTSGSLFDLSSGAAECIISDELATYNSLAVGDTIQLANPNQESETVSLKITGIYHNEESAGTEPGGMRGFQASSDPANQIYTSYSALKKAADASAASAATSTDSDTGMTTSTAMRTQVSGTYVFASVEDYEAFPADAKSMGLSDSYTISSSDVNNYEQSLLPLRNLSKYAAYFLLVVLAIGGIILVVLHMFNIRERKYEIGVLTAMGMKKAKVAAQFITEIFVVTIFAILVGTGIGAAVSVPTTNALLESQVTAQEQTAQTQQANFGMGGGQAPGGEPGSRQQGKTASYLTSVTSAADWMVVLELVGIGLALTLISGCIAIAFVARYEPLKILNNRD